MNSETSEERNLGSFILIASERVLNLDFIHFEPMAPTFSCCLARYSRTKAKSLTGDHKLGM